MIVGARLRSRPAQVALVVGTAIAVALMAFVTAPDLRVPASWRHVARHSSALRGRSSASSRRSSALRGRPAQGTDVSG
jgi:hypothetical protein